MSQAWIIVTPPTNWTKTADLGFTVQGVKSTRGRLAQRIQPGDRLFYYITGRKKFAGIVRVTSPMYEEHTRVWATEGRPNEVYPYRFRIEAELVLPEDRWVDAEPLARQMEHARRWPAANWTLAFQGNLHAIPEGDARALDAALRAAAGTAAGR